MISGTFGSFNINDTTESLRKMEIDGGDFDWKTKYQMKPIEPKGNPYRCICHSLDIRFGQIIDLELSASVSGRMIVAKSPYKNKFKKTYKNYGEFLKEWEETG